MTISRYLFSFLCHAGLSMEGTVPCAFISKVLLRKTLSHCPTQNDVSNIIVRYRVIQKSCSIKVKKKCKKKWRWSCRKMKTWHIYNNNIVFLFTKKLIPNLDFSSRYGIIYVKFSWFWYGPNILKTRSEIVLCLSIPLQKFFLFQAV